MNDLLKTVAAVPAFLMLAIAVMLCCGAMCLVIALIAVVPSN